MFWVARYVNRVWKWDPTQRGSEVQTRYTGFRQCIQLPEPANVFYESWVSASGKNKLQSSYTQIMRLKYILMILSITCGDYCPQVFKWLLSTRLQINSTQLDWLIGVFIGTQTFVPLNVSVKRNALPSFFLPRLYRTEMVCACTHYRSVSGCVCSTIVCSIIYIQAKLLDVCALLLFAALYTYRLKY